MTTPRSPRTEERDPLAELGLLVNDPWWYIPRMGIVDKDGKRLSLRTIRPEQREVLAALIEHLRVCILKPRQIGITTIVTAFMFWRSLFSTDQYNWLSLTHEDKACYRVNQMLRTYAATTPAAWRPKFYPNNTRHIGFRHNGSEFMQLMAGGRSQARGFTFQGLHCTEQGLWPRGSSAREGTDVDAQAWISAMSTLGEGPNKRVIVESTAKGPAGIFYENVRAARESGNWEFLFFPWSDFAEYSIDPPRGWERTDEEQELVDLYGLNDRQLAWRRRKIVDENYGLYRFREEYPLTWEEPFLLSGGMWFDTEFLNKLLALIPRERLNATGEYHQYAKFDANRKYYIGGDVGGGVGADESVWDVIRDDLVQVAVFASNKLAPRAFADRGAELSLEWGKARILCESNKYGKAVIERLEGLNAKLWKDKDDKDWWSDPRSKAMLYDYGRHVVNNGHAEIEDPESIAQMLRVREQRNGNIEADEGYRDDRSIAKMLAFWNAREQYDVQQRPLTLAQRIDRRRRLVHRKLGLSP